MNHGQALADLGRPLVVVVTGGRDYADVLRVRWALDGLRERYGIARLHAGDANGADSHALAWANLREVPSAVHLAGWAEHGKRAGPLRNRAMLDAARPDLVVAFPGGAGTSDCVKQAEARGMRVWKVKP